MELPSENEQLVCLKKYWGHSTFRLHQKDVIESILYGRDALVLMATGKGKSLCYQLPAIVARECQGFRCCTVVLSPLISLIEDQVRGLNANGVKAINISGASSETCEKVVHGEYALIYITPERLESFIPSLKRMYGKVGICCFAIDEAHCISQWGNDFRPSYLKLGKIREQFPDVPLIALSATATHKIQNDILKILHMEDPYIVKTSVNRPNLFYKILPKSSSMEQDLGSILNSKEGSTIVYVLTKNEAETIAKVIQEKLKIKAGHYHAGMSPEARRSVYLSWSRDELRVVVATISFAMGIDKPDVRLIIHYGLAKSIEDYYQQTGRAGRDGEDSYCIMYWAPKDSVTLSYLASQVHHNSPSSGAAANVSKIQAMEKFARASGCRRKALLAHFDEEMREDCQGCDFCELGLSSSSAQEAGVVLRGILTPKEYKDCALAVFKAVERMRSGVRKVVLMLEGSEIKEMRERADFQRLKQCDAWGFAKGKRNSAWWKAWVKQLMDENYLETQQMAARQGSMSYQIVVLGDKARSMLDGRATLQLTGMVASQDLVDAEGQYRREQQRAEAMAQRQKLQEKQRAESQAKIDELYQALLSFRNSMAERKGLSGYQVVQEPQLRALARVRPSSLQSLQDLGGWPQQKIQEYGQIFLDFLAQKSDALGLAKDAVVPLQPYQAAAAAPAIASTKPIRQALAESHRLFMEEAKSVHEIAISRPKPIKESTVRSYLVEAHTYYDLPLQWERLGLPTNLLDAVKQAIENLLSLSPGIFPHTASIRPILSDYLPGEPPAEYGDVEAARVMIHRRDFSHIPLTANRVTAPAAPQGAVGTSVSSTPSSLSVYKPLTASNGGWLSTRKRPASILSSFTSPAAPAGKLHQPTYLKPKSSSLSDDKSVTILSMIMGQPLGLTIEQICGQLQGRRSRQDIKSELDALQGIECAIYFDGSKYRAI